MTLLFTLSLVSVHTYVLIRIVTKVITLVRKNVFTVLR